MKLTLADPGLCNRKPTIRGLRVRVQAVLEYLGVGDSREALRVLAENNLTVLQKSEIQM
jgi:uncharacterized protein (DUF433 family)